MKLYKHGMVFGKFMPMTAGHQRLFNKALEECEKVTIVVCSLPTEPIDGELRFEWVRSTYPQARVLHYSKEDAPQTPEDCETPEDFWDIWRHILVDHAGGMPIDILYGGEEYIVKMAETIGCKWHLLNRDVFPISATMIRNNPMVNWGYIPRIVRPYFAKKVLVVGGMSTGKSTLVEALADHYGTNFVPEVARTYIENHGFCYDNFVKWAWEHKRTIDLMTQFSNRVLFVDTDAKTTEMYSRMYYKKTHDEIKSLAQKEKYDLALLMTPEIPFVEEEGRDFPDRRWEIHGMIKDRLIKENIPFVEIGGSNWDDRLKLAINAVKGLGVM